MVKKGVVILLAGVLVFTIYRGFVSNFLVLREINFADEKKQSDKTKESMVDNIKTIYSSQALQAHDDYLGTYKGEESVWTNQVDGVVGDTGLSSGKIKKDERTGLWWSASSSSNKITNRLDVVNTDGLRVTGGNAVAFCDGLNKVAFGGKSDWYLPTQKELMQAYIDGIYSQDREFGGENPYWAATVLSSDNTTPVCVHMGWGYAFQEDKFITGYSVRCVRQDR